MIRLSESRISHLSHLIMDGLRDFFQREDHIDEMVRQKIASLSRSVPPGSREWDVLYRKYFEEESRKQRK